MNSSSMEIDISSISISNKSNFVYSLYFIETVRKINVSFTIIIFLIGLIGNSITIFVFSKKKFRTNSSNIYLFCLAIVDTLFLIVHVFEDTIRHFSNDMSSYDSSYADDNDFNFNITANFKSFFTTINITDQSNFICRFINYMRYVLRFVSAYIVVLFTIQRVIVISKPLKSYIITKKSAWIKTFIIVLISLTINIWVPFIFVIKDTDQEYSHCDVIERWQKEYIMITFLYICLIMFVPIITIIISNSIILYSILKANNSHKNLTNNITQKRNTKQVGLAPKNVKLKPYYFNVKQMVLRNNNQRNEDVKKITRMLCFISSSYALLNLPYLITWFIYICNAINKPSEAEQQNYIFSFVKLSEIFYLFNYSVKFYLYCASGSTFKNQFKLASKYK